MGENQINIIRRNCRSCDKIVYFTDSIRAPNGTRRPLEPNLTEYHKCEQPSREELGAYFNSERLALDAVDYIQRINNRLEGFYLRLERVPR